MRCVRALAFITVLFLIVIVTAVASSTAAPPATRRAVERGIRECVNDNRRDAGLAPLRASRVLSEAARLHARNMARQHFFDHVDPRGRDVGERVAIFDRAGRYALVGENIAAGYRTVAATCEGWMHSAGHRANILRRDYTSLGSGFARGGEYGRYYVQVFAAAED